MAKKWTIRQFEDEVCRLDPTMKANDPTFKTAVLLLSALQVGTHINKLTQFTGYPRKLVSEKVKSARRQKIFVKNDVVCDWFDDAGGVSFWMDVLAVEGLLSRTSA